MEQIIFKIRKLSYIEVWGPTIMMVFLCGYLHVLKGYDMTNLEEIQADSFKAKSFLSDNMSLDDKVKNMDSFKKVEKVKSSSFNTTNSDIVSSLNEQERESEKETAPVEESPEAKGTPIEEKNEKPKVVYQKVYVAAPKKEEQIEQEAQGEVYIANRRSIAEQDQSKNGDQTNNQFVKIETLEEVRYTTGKIFNVNVALSEAYIFEGKTYKRNSLAIMTGLQRGGQLQLKLTKLYYKNQASICQITVYDQFENQTLSMNNKNRSTQVGDEATDIYNNKLNEASVDVGGVGTINVGKFLKKDKNGKEYGYIHRGSSFYIK